MKKSLIAVAGGSRLVGVDSRNHEYFVADLFRKACKAGHIVQDGLGIVGRAGADNEYKTVVLPRKIFLSPRRVCP